MRRNANGVKYSCKRALGSINRGMAVTRGLGRVRATPENVRKKLALHQDFSGNGAADFEGHVEENYERVFNVIYRYMGDYEETCDLTQDTFIHAYQAYERFRGEAQVFTWLYRIAINLCKNRRRQLQRLRGVEKESLEVEADDEQSGPRQFEDRTYSPERQFVQSEIDDVIQRGIDALSSDQRVVVILRDIEGFSYAQVAKIVGCSVEAVKARLFRARTQLRKKLRPFLEK